MVDIRDSRYLELVEYKDASLLKARIYLHQRFSTNTYGWFKWVMDQVEPTSGMKILEIGCGPGTLWVENVARIPADCSVTLSDYSPGMGFEARGNPGGNKK